MYWKQLIALITASIAFVSCDDNTSTLGMDMIPASDLVTKTYKTYDVKTSSFAVGDSVLSRTSTSYFGQYTDPITSSTVKSDFLSQFNSPMHKVEGTLVGDTAFSTSIVLTIDKFVGDSLAPLSVEVYELDSLLDANKDYYTNIDPSKFIKKGAKPVGVARFTASDRSLADTTRQRYHTNGIKQVTIPLNNEIGTSIIKAVSQDPTLTEPENWHKSGVRGSKGFYFKLSSGDGAMFYISSSYIYIPYMAKQEDGDIDTLYNILEGTEEVVQASRFESHNIEALMKDTDATYLKCPAGVFTMAELPIDSISANDTINSASIKFTRYNDDAETLNKIDKQYRLGVPTTVLLVRYDDYINGFFESYKLADNVTSYLTTFNASTNSYTFNNISRLITTMLQEKKNGTATANCNKVLIIPVEATTVRASNYSSETVVKINHDFSMKSARLVGGKDGGVQIEVIYSRFIR